VRFCSRSLLRGVSPSTSQFLQQRPGIGGFPDRGCDSAPMPESQWASDDHIAAGHWKETP
jgi:hypothetical protein